MNAGITVPCRRTPVFDVFIASQNVRRNPISSLSGFVKGSTLTTGQDARALMQSADAAAKLVQGSLDKILPCKSVPTT